MIEISAQELEETLRTSKNLEIATEFWMYCFNHPGERFWQAVRNWSGNQQILVVNGESSGDTFYFEGLDK